MSHEFAVPAMRGGIYFFGSIDVGFGPVICFGQSGWEASIDIKSLSEVGLFFVICLSPLEVHASGNC